MAICHCGEMDSICDHSPCHHQATQWWDEMKISGVSYEEFEERFWELHGDKDGLSPSNKDYWIPFKRFKLMVRDCGLSYSYHNIPNRLYLVKDLVDEMCLEARIQREMETREIIAKREEAEAIAKEKKQLAQDRIREQNDINALKHENETLKNKLELLEKELELIKASGMGPTTVNVSHDGTSDGVNTTSTVRMEQVSTKPREPGTSGSDKQNSGIGVAVTVNNNFQSKQPMGNRFRK